MNWAEESNSGTRSGFYTFLIREGVIDARNSIRNACHGGSSVRSSGVPCNGGWVSKARIRVVRSLVMLPGKLRCLEVSEHAPKSERRTWNREEAEIGTWARTPRQS